MKTDYPVTNVLHSIRVHLGINLVDYAILEYITINSRFKPIQANNSVIGESLGVGSAMVAASLRRLLSEDLIENTPDGLAPTITALSAMYMDIETDEFNTRSMELGSYFLRRLREISEEFRCGYISPPPHTNKASVRSVANKISVIQKKHRVEETDLDLIISWAVKNWGFNNDMRDYVRASTLLGSANKYDKYREIAKQYWMSQKNVSTKVY